MLTKSPSIAFDGRCDLTHLAPTVPSGRSPHGFTDLDDSAKPSRGATRSADPQASFRTLTGLRFRPVDESAICIGAGEL